MFQVSSGNFGRPSVRTRWGSCVSCFLLLVAQQPVLELVDATLNRLPARCGGKRVVALSKRQRLYTANLALLQTFCFVLFCFTVSPQKSQSRSCTRLLLQGKVHKVYKALRARINFDRRHCSLVANDVVSVWACEQK